MRSVYRKAIMLILLTLILFSTSFDTVYHGTIYSAPYGNFPPIVAIEWGSLVQPQNVTPGDFNVPLYVVIKADVIGASLLSTTYQPFGQISTPINGYILSANKTQSTIVFFVNVPLNVSSGLYKVFLSINYTYDSGIFEATTQIPIYISSVIYPKVIFQWGNGEFTSPGQGISPLTVTVENPSNKVVSNVIISAELPNGIYSLTGSRIINFTVPAVQPYSAVSVTQYVNVTSEISPGSYYVNYTLTFTDDLGGVHTATYNNGTLVLFPKEPLIVKSDPISLQAGQISTFIIYLNSTGALLTSFSVNSQSVMTVRYNVTTPITFSGVLPISISVYVPYGTTPGIYQFTITGTYIYGGTQYSFTIPDYVEVGINRTGPEVVNLEWVSYPYPGSSSQAELTVFNPLPYPVYSVNISTHSVETGQPYYVIQEIPPYGSVQIPISLLVPDNASSLVCLYFNINYYSEYGGFASSSKMIIPVYSKPLISLSLVPSTVVQGQQSEVLLEIRNLVNQSLFDLHVNVVFSDIQVVGATNATIYQLNPSYTGSIPYSIYVPSYLSPGVYPVQVTISYYYSGIQNTQVFTLPLVVTSAQNGINVYISPSTLYYQVSQNLTITLFNSDNYTVTNIFLKIFTNSQLLSLSQTQFEINAIPPHYNYTITVHTFSPISATETLPLSLSLQYQTPDGFVSYNENLSLLITGLISIQIIQPSVTEVNGSYIFQATLLNDGNTQANNVIIYYPGGSTYIGQLPTASPLPISVTLPSNSSRIPIVISYQTPTYQTVNMTYSYNGPITVLQTTSTTTSPHNLFGSALLFGISVIVVVVIIYLLLKRRKKANEDI